MEIELDNGTRFSYLGKPSRSVARKAALVLASARGTAGTVTSIEFDRKNIVSATVGGIWHEWWILNEQRMYESRFDSQLYHYYHPFRTRDEGFSWMLQPYWSKRIGKHFVYSPVRTLKFYQVETYKRWCKDSELEWTRRDARKAELKEQPQIGFNWRMAAVQPNARVVVMDSVSEVYNELLNRSAQAQRMQQDLNPQPQGTPIAYDPEPSWGSIDEDSL